MQLDLHLLTDTDFLESALALITRSLIEIHSYRTSRQYIRFGNFDPHCTGRDIHIVLGKPIDVDPTTGDSLFDLFITPGSQIVLVIPTLLGL